MKVIYFEKNGMKNGKIIKYDPTISKGKHTIQLDEDSTERVVSLKTAVKRKRVVLIEPNRYTLKNIVYIKNYLLLYLSSQSLRRKCWKPTSRNQSTTKFSKRNKFEYHGTHKSLRSDWMLQQKFAFAECIQGEFNGFLRMMVGGCYELVDGQLICVTDVIYTQGSQLIHYIEIYKFCYIYIYFVFSVDNDNDTLHFFENRESDILEKIIRIIQQTEGYWRPKDTEKEILRKYQQLARKDNVVIPAIESIKQRMVFLFKIKQYVKKNICFYYYH